MGKPPHLAESAVIPRRHKVASRVTGASGCIERASICGPSDFSESAQPNSHVQRTGTGNSTKGMPIQEIDRADLFVADGQQPPVRTECDPARQVPARGFDRTRNELKVRIVQANGSAECPRRRRQASIASEGDAKALVAVVSKSFGPPSLLIEHP